MHTESECKTFDSQSAIKHWSQASGSLSAKELSSVASTCEACKEVLHCAVVDLIKASAGRPILNSKSADGTPCSVRVRTQASRPSGSKVTRSGKHSVELLVKNQFLRCYINGKPLTKVLLQEPMPLDHGKPCPAQFEACRKDWKSLRQLGHAGPAIEHYCFDRFGISGHERLWRQWHAMVADSFQHLAVNSSTDLLQLSEFVLITGCAAHDAQSAFRWALHKELADADLLRDVYVSVEALRNSYDLITSRLLSWISQRLSYAPAQSAFWMQHQRFLWQALDVEMETQEILSSTLQLRFENGRLWVVDDVSTMPDGLDTISTALLSTWRFVRWSDTRFLTVGASSRTIIAGLLTGLGDLVEYIRQDPTASKFYINGFSRLQGDRKVFLAQCAVISRVAEGALSELLEDPRVCKQYDLLWEAIGEEMRWLVEASPVFWGALAAISGTTADELRHRCIAGGHISFTSSGGESCVLLMSFRGGFAEAMFGKTSWTSSLKTCHMSLSLVNFGC